MPPDSPPPPRMGLGFTHGLLEGLVDAGWLVGELVVGDVTLVAGDVEVGELVVGDVALVELEVAVEPEPELEFDPCRQARYWGWARCPGWSRAPGPRDPAARA